MELKLDYLGLKVELPRDYLIQQILVKTRLFRVERIEFIPDDFEFEPMLKLDYLGLKDLLVHELRRIICSVKTRLFRVERDYEIVDNVAIIEC